MAGAMIVQAPTLTWVTPNLKGNSGSFSCSITWALLHTWMHCVVLSLWRVLLEHYAHGSHPELLVWALP